MDALRVLPALLLLGVPFLGGCRAHVEQGERHHVGAKIDVSDLIKNTAAYKGKAITLPLRVDEPIARDQGQSLRNYAGRDVRFTALTPRGQRLDLVVRIPEGLPVPEAGNGDEVLVTLLCTRGSLRQGNEARAIQLP